jgi:hypothetical protein
LKWISIWFSVIWWTPKNSYLSEGERVDSVLGGNLETDVGASLGVPDSLGTGLDLWVDLVVVGSGEDAQVVRSNDGGGVEWLRVTNAERVSGDSSLLDIITSLSTNEETIMSDDSVQVGSWAFEEIKESAGVEVWLLEVEVELDSLGLGAWEEVAQNLSLEALGNVVCKLNLGLEDVGGVPALGNGHACAVIEY